MYNDEYDDEQPLNGSGYEAVDTETERLESALAAERSLLLELQLEQDEQGEQPQPEESPAKKKLKREAQREAIARLERAARTEADFRIVTDWWDKLDANRERKERYHEVSRNGDFLDVIFNCPYEVHELVTEEYLSTILSELSADHKEILFLHAVRAYSSNRIGAIRGQSDRNIRKVRATLFRKIYKKLFPVLAERLEQGYPMTREERQFAEGMKKSCP